MVTLLVASVQGHVVVVEFSTDLAFFRQGLSVKLTTVVRKGDTYHPLLVNFSFSRLLEAVQSYVDAYLQMNPSDYLIKVHNPYSPHLFKFSFGHLTSLRSAVWDTK